MLSALAVLFEPTDIVELRVIHKAGSRGKRIDSGYFDHAHWSDLATHADRLNRQGAAVYVTLNPPDPQLLGRCCNRMQEFAKETTGDKNILRRRWLLVDLDPTRPANTSATPVQVEAAVSVACSIFAETKRRGWGSPIVAQSGNGMHLLYAIDLPNDAASEALVKLVLAGLGEAFEIGRAHV